MKKPMLKIFYQSGPHLSRKIPVGTSRLKHMKLMPTLSADPTVSHLVCKLKHFLNATWCPSIAPFKEGGGYLKVL